MIAVAGVAFGQQATQGQVVDQISGLVGRDGAELIQGMIASAGNRSTGIVATVLGIVTLLLGASGLFGALHDSLNTIWEVQPKPAGIMGMLRQRFVSFTMVLGVGFLLLVSLVLTTALAALGRFVGGLTPGSELLAQILNFIVSFGVITLLFALIYKILPDVDIEWKDVWIGAAATSLLFTIGRTLIGLYLGRSGAASAYGAAGSLVLMLLWVYYSAQILFLGAEFTQVYAKRFGSRIRPSANAVAVTEEARAQQGLVSRSGEPGAGKKPPTQAAEPGRRGGPVPRGVPAASGMLAAGTRQNEHSARPWIMALLGFVIGVVLSVVRTPR